MFLLPINQLTKKGSGEFALLLNIENCSKKSNFNGVLRPHARDNYHLGTGDCRHFNALFLFSKNHGILSSCEVLLLYYEEKAKVVEESSFVFIKAA